MELAPAISPSCRAKWLAAICRFKALFLVMCTSRQPVVGRRNHVYTGHARSIEAKVEFR